jgi:pimeloyl-ACP methyl ester carboxylesterase
MLNTRCGAVAIILQAYTSRHNEKVEKLVLYAPVWIRQTASLVQAGAGPLGAYRSVNMAQARERWMTGVPEDKKPELIPPGWFDAWAAATLASDSMARSRLRRWDDRILFEHCQYGGPTSARSSASR